MNLEVGGNQRVPGGPSCPSVSGERAAGCKECSSPPTSYSGKGKALEAGRV